METEDLRTLRHEGERIERLLDELRAEVGAGPWQRLDEVVRRLLALHGAGIDRLLALLAGAGALDGPVLERLYADDRVASLLVIHGLHPLPVAARIERAIASALDRLRAPAGAARLLALDGDGARLRISATAHAPPDAPGPAAIAAAVRRAIETAAPEVMRIEVEGDGAAPAEAAVPRTTTAPGLVQIRLPPRKASVTGAHAHADADADAPAAPRADARARCEICGVPLGDDHAHVVETARRSIGCACRPCALLFSSSAGAAQARYRAIPERVLFDPELTITEEQWSELHIPVRTAFLFFNSSLDCWAAFYPSPAGAMESELALEAWAALAARSRLIQAAEPDVEALLVHGDRRGGGLDCFLVPIDACYDLVARVRLHWQGASGGPAAWREIDAFFATLRGRGRPLPGARPNGHRAASPPAMGARPGAEPPAPVNTVEPAS